MTNENNLHKSDKNIWFIADTHFKDDRFEIMQRPFKTLDEMHNLIIKNWNEVISPEDTVYHVGDVVYNAKPEDLKIINELNGEKHLFIGNHDKLPKEEYLKYFKTVNDNLLLNIEHEGSIIEKLYINHYPVRGSKEYFNICGHVHSAFKVQLNQINCGVDVWHFRPVSLKQIFKTIKAIKEFYDDDVWVAYNEINEKYKDRHRKGSYSDNLK